MTVYIVFVTPKIRGKGGPPLNPPLLCHVSRESFLAPTLYPFVYHFDRRGTLFIYLKLKKRYSFHHFHPQRLRSFWSAPGIVTSGGTQFSEHEQQHQKSLIHGLPIKSDKSDWLRI